MDSAKKLLTQQSVLAAGVMNDYDSPSKKYGCISQVSGNSTATNPKVSAGVVQTLPGGNNFENHDPRVIGFQKGAANKALVIDYKYETSASLYGVFNPTAGGNWGTPVVKNNAAWGISNPYSIVTTNANDMYIMGYDSAQIIKIKMTNFNAASGNPFYTYTPLPGKTGHGVDMVKVTIGTKTYLAALFINSAGYSNYGNSQLVLIDVTNGSEYKKINLNANANSLAVSTDNYAYVTSFGGMQQPGGNTTSKLQVVNLTTTSPTPVNIGMVSPVSAGDYVDIALVGTRAYVLTANFNATYSEYTYRLIKTTQARLKNGSFGTSSQYSTYSATVDAGATWLLAYDGTVLWFVAGKRIYTIKTSVNLSSTALIQRANADLNVPSGPGKNFGLGISRANGQLNTASVVIPYAARGMRGAAVGGQTKFSKCMLPPEELEKFRKAQIKKAKSGK